MQQTTQQNPPGVGQTTAIAAQDLNTLSTLEALKIIKQSQQQHGLRHQDYQRYRSYCTRRIRRLRKTLGAVCGNERRYQKKELVAEEINDSKLLLIPLFQAERAWAYGMQLKQESNSEQRKKFHVITRLRKAVKHSVELEKLSSKCDARTKLEAQGYNSWMNGQFFFEVQKWDESLKHFNIAKKIYQKLSEALSSDELKQIYLQKADEMTPNIRYCAYNIGDETAIKDLVEMKLKSTGSELAENIDFLISQTKEKQITTFSEVNWRNKTLQVKNEKVRLFLLNVQEFEKQIQSSDSFDVKQKIYDDILKESVDAIQTLRDELKADTGFKAFQRSQESEEKPSNLLLLFFYLTYLRLSKTVERNLLMVSQYEKNLGKADENMKVTKPQDIVRLYDIIIQNYGDMAAIPAVKNDDGLMNDSQIHLIYFNTFRAYHVSLFYMNNKKYREAAGFIHKCEANAKELEGKFNKLSSSSAISVDVINSGLAKLKAELNSNKYKLQSSAILEDENETEKLASESDSNMAAKLAEIAKIPPQFTPIHCKPLYFDLALNHIELPTFEEKSDSTTQAQASGIKGMLKGFLGFK